MWRTRVDDFLVLHWVALQVIDLLFQISDRLGPFRIELLDGSIANMIKPIHREK